MANKKAIIKTVTDVSILAETETLVIFKVNKPLTESDFKALSNRIKFENAESGLKIILAPCIVDGVEIK
jgi:hypothetical protein